MQIAAIERVYQVGLRDEGNSIQFELLVYDADGAEEDLVISIPAIRVYGHEEDMSGYMDLRPATEDQRRILALLELHWSNEAEAASERQFDSRNC